MSKEAEAVDAYLDTIKRLEPDISMIDLDAGMASIAISLKRIADALNKPNDRAEVGPAAIAGEVQPTVIDNDQGEITVSLSGRELRGWSYSSNDERRQKMVQAREYIEGWCDGRACP